MGKPVELQSSFKEMEQSGWHAKASNYDSFAGKITNQATETLLDAVNVTSGMSVLDVACGTGYGAGAAAARGANATGIDFAPGMLAEAHKNFPHVQFKDGDAENLPFNNDSFDAVICPFGLLHIADPDRAVSEAYRVLRKGGGYSFSVWATPETHEFFAVVMAAIEEFGNMQAPLPPAPSIFRFSDPAECNAVLASTGFTGINVVEIKPTWRATNEQQILDMIYTGTVRTAALLELQKPQALKKIHTSIIRNAETYRDNEGFCFSWPAVVASGYKAG